MEPASGRYVRYEIFRSSLKSWSELFEMAAAYAERIGPERLISISQSADHSEGVVTVWYWSDEPGPGSR